MKNTTLNYEVVPHAVIIRVTNAKGRNIGTVTAEKENESFKVVYDGPKTTVILADGSKGISKQNPEDTYNRQIGLDIAYNRAKIISLKKQNNILRRSANN